RLCDPAADGGLQQQLAPLGGLGPRSPNIIRNEPGPRLHGHGPNRSGAQRPNLRGSGGRPPEDTTSDVVRAFREHTSPERVEVPGIEPGSSVALTGLLRAQFTLPLLGPTGHVNLPM